MSSLYDFHKASIGVSEERRAMLEPFAAMLRRGDLVVLSLLCNHTLSFFRLAVFFLFLSSVSFSEHLGGKGGQAEKACKYPNASDL